MSYAKLSEVRRYLALLEEEIDNPNTSWTLADQEERAQWTAYYLATLSGAAGALTKGAVFVFPRSLYRSYVEAIRQRHPAPRSGDAYHNHCKGVRLPYDEVIFVEVEDSPQSDRFYDPETDFVGRVTAMVIARSEPGGIFTAGVTVMRDDLARPSLHIAPYRCQFSDTVTEIVTAWLNSRHVSTERCTLPEKVVKKRERSGRSTRNRSFTVVSHSNTGGQDSSREGGQAGRWLPAHLVRGHFKRRKTGVYWWRPHVAGKGPVRRREGYVTK